MQMQYTKNLNPGRSELGTTFVGSSLEAELVSSKHIIQVNLEILSRSVENMASHWLHNILLEVNAVNLSVN